MSDFEKLKEELPSKRKFYDYFAGKNLVAKNLNILLMFGRNLK